MARWTASLKVLNVNTNKLENLFALPDLHSLEEFDCGANPINPENGIKSLESVGKWRSLKKVGFAGCEFADGIDCRLELLIRCDHLKLKTVNDEEVEDDHRTAAKEEKENRIQAAKEAAEEAARLAAEKAAEGEQKVDEEEN